MGKFTIFFALLGTVSIVSCLSSFVPMAGFEYVGTADGKIFVTPMLSGSEEYGISWQSAVERCASAGYRMAIIESQAQNDVVDQFITAGTGIDSRKWSWIDGTNFLSSDNWFSISTGQNLTYFNWVNTRPVGDTKIRCLRWSHNSGEKGIWDVSCSDDKNSVICETRQA